MTLKRNRFYKNIVDQIIEAHLKLGPADETIRLYYPLESLNAYLGTDFVTLQEACDALLQIAADGGYAPTDSDGALTDSVGMPSDADGVLSSAPSDGSRFSDSFADDVPSADALNYSQRTASASNSQTASSGPLIISFPDALHYRLSDGRLEVLVSSQNVHYIDKNFHASPFLKDLIDLFSFHGHDLSVETVRALFCRYSSDVVCESVPEDSGFDVVLRFRDKSIDEYNYCLKTEMGHLIYHRFMDEDFEQLMK